jgi:hypothetical protein
MSHDESKHSSTKLYFWSEEKIAAPICELSRSEDSRDSTWTLQVPIRIGKSSR